MSRRPRIASRATVPLLVSLDVEEDAWGHDLRPGVTAENVRELPRLAEFFARLEVRATYFATYVVVTVPWAARVLGALAAEYPGAVGAHLHPWNTPPELDATRSMLNTLPTELQRAKLRSLKHAMRNALGFVPLSFRAGRFGLGSDTVRILAEEGFSADSSVTPYHSWRLSSGGPDMIGSPVNLYRLDGSGDVRRPVAGGAIVEVPISGGFTGLPAWRWSEASRLHESRLSRAAMLPSIAARALNVRRTLLCPETTSLSDLIDLSRRLIDADASHLHMFFHSSSLMPGLNPFVRKQADVDNLYAKLERYLDRLSAFVTPEFLTVKELAEQYRARTDAASAAA